MKTMFITATQCETNAGLVASLFQTAFTSLQFRSANGGNRRTTRTARRSAPEQSAVRHLNSNPNLRRALQVVGGGASGKPLANLEYPIFEAIATRRDAPVALTELSSLGRKF
jgi:hypothetical protein